MRGEIVPVTGREVVISGDHDEPPALITAAGKAALFAYAEFFGALCFLPYDASVGCCLATYRLTLIWPSRSLASAIS